MKAQAKILKGKKKPVQSYWVIRSDRRKGAPLPKLPTSSGK
jgi:hypothetical protein